MVELEGSKGNSTKIIPRKVCGIILRRKNDDKPKSSKRVWTSHGKDKVDKNIM